MKKLLILTFILLNPASLYAHEHTHYPVNIPCPTSPTDKVTITLTEIIVNAPTHCYMHMMECVFRLTENDQTPVTHRFTLSPLASKIALLMFAGKEAPFNILTTLSNFADLSLDETIAASDLGFLAELAPGFHIPSARKLKSILVPETLADLKTQLNFDDDETLESLLYIDEIHTKSTDFKSQQFSPVHVVTNVEITPSTLTVFCQHPLAGEIKIFSVQKRLAQIITLQHMLGLRAPNLTRNMIQDLFHRKRIPTDMMHLTYLPRNFGTVEGFASIEIKEQYAYQLCLQRYLSLQKGRLPKIETYAPHRNFIPQIPDKKFSTKAYVPKPVQPVILPRALRPQQVRPAFPRYAMMLRKLKR